MKHCTLLAIAAAFLTGCCGSRDVTNDPEFNKGFVPGQTYRLLQDVFIDESGRLVLPRHSSIPPTAAHYYARPTDWPEVKGVVEAGSEVRVERLMMGPWNVRTVLIEGKVLTGKQAGKEVTLQSLSAPDWTVNPKWDADVRTPNPDVLVPKGP